MDRYQKLIQWNIPEDCHTYIFSKNLFPVIEQIVNELKYDSKFTGVFFGHEFKYVEGHYRHSKDFQMSRIVELFRFVKENGLQHDILRYMLPVCFEHPKMDFNSVLETIKFKKTDAAEIIKDIPFLKKQFASIRHSQKEGVETAWIMGELHMRAVGNISLASLKETVEKTKA
jgi:glutamyl-tRNA(Gln) amidotransferase subunit E